MSVNPTLFDGDHLRDRGIARVATANSEWMDEAIAVCHEHRTPGRLVTGEDIRKFVELTVGKPTSPNVWGALVRRCCLAGLLVDTGTTAKPTDPKSHSSRKPVWRWT